MSAFPWGRTSSWPPWHLWARRRGQRGAGRRPQTLSACPSPARAPAPSQANRSDDQGQAVTSAPWGAFSTLDSVLANCGPHGPTRPHGAAPPPSRTRSAVLAGRRPPGTATPRPTGVPAEGLGDRSAWLRSRGGRSRSQRRWCRTSLRPSSPMHRCCPWHRAAFPGDQGSPGCSERASWGRRPGPGLSREGWGGFAKACVQAPRSRHCPGPVRSRLAPLTPAAAAGAGAGANVQLPVVREGAEAQSGHLPRGICGNISSFCPCPDCWQPP